MKGNKVKHLDFIYSCSGEYNALCPHGPGVGIDTTATSQPPPDKTGPTGITGPGVRTTPFPPGGTPGVPGRGKHLKLQHKSLCENIFFMILFCNQLR